MQTRRGTILNANPVTQPRRRGPIRANVDRPLANQQANGIQLGKRRRSSSEEKKFETRKRLRDSAPRNELKRKRSLSDSENGTNSGPKRRKLSGSLETDTATLLPSSSPPLTTAPSVIRTENPDAFPSHRFSFIPPPRDEVILNTNAPEQHVVNAIREVPTENEGALNPNSLNASSPSAAPSTPAIPENAPEPSLPPLPSISSITSPSPRATSSTDQPLPPFSSTPTRRYASAGLAIPRELALSLPSAIIVSTSSATTDTTTLPAAMPESLRMPSSNPPIALPGGDAPLESIGEAVLARLGESLAPVPQDADMAFQPITGADFDSEVAHRPACTPPSSRTNFLDATGPFTSSPEPFTTAEAVVMSALAQGVPPSPITPAANQEMGLGPLAESLAATEAVVTSTALSVPPSPLTVAVDQEMELEPPASSSEPFPATETVATSPLAQGVPPCPVTAVVDQEMEYDGESESSDQEDSDTDTNDSSSGSSLESGDQRRSASGSVDGESSSESDSNGSSSSDDESSSSGSDTMEASKTAPAPHSPAPSQHTARSILRSRSRSFSSSSGFNSESVASGSRSASHSPARSEHAGSSSSSSSSSESGTSTSSGDEEDFNENTRTSSRSTSNLSSSPSDFDMEEVKPATDSAPAKHRSVNHGDSPSLASSDDDMSCDNKPNPKSPCARTRSVSHTSSSASSTSSSDQDMGSETSSTGSSSSSSSLQPSDVNMDAPAEPRLVFITSSSDSSNDDMSCDGVFTAPSNHSNPPKPVHPPSDILNDSGNLVGWNDYSMDEDRPSPHQPSPHSNGRETRPEPSRPSKVLPLYMDDSEVPMDEDQPPPHLSNPSSDRETRPEPSRRSSDRRPRRPKHQAARCDTATDKEEPPKRSKGKQPQRHQTASDQTRAYQKHKENEDAWPGEEEEAQKPRMPTAGGSSRKEGSGAGSKEEFEEMVFELLSEVRSKSKQAEILTALKEKDADLYAIIGLLATHLGFTPESLKSTIASSSPQRPGSKAANIYDDEGFRRVKHRLQAHLNLARLVRGVARRLLQPDGAPLTSLTHDQRVDWQRHGTGGPTIKHFVLDLASRHTWKDNVWNQRATQVFARHFVGLEGFEKYKVFDVVKAFKTHLRALRESFLQQSPISDHKQVHMKERRDMRRRSHRDRRIGSIRLFADRCPEMQAYVGIAKDFTIGMMSGEETDRERSKGKGPSACKSCIALCQRWRAPGLTPLMQDLDALHIASRYLGNGKYSRGQFPTIRLRTSNKPDLEYEDAPIGLPENWYDRAFLDELPGRREALKMKPPVSLRLPDAVLRIARRFRHVQHRTDLPLDPKEVSLD
ncbi:SUN domain-containing protein 3 [Marasmius crinis-equi]|uniref:SUN domain-containing protein 3 n=1 Tax=Marasmius crinis-equi TaxID=585013 RepID=A0ABR3FDT6_9AGAR